MKITCYLVQPRHQVFVKGYGFWLLLKVWTRTLVKI